MKKVVFLLLIAALFALPKAVSAQGGGSDWTDIIDTNPGGPPTPPPGGGTGSTPPPPSTDSFALGREEGAKVAKQLLDRYRQFHSYLGMAIVRVCPEDDSSAKDCTYVYKFDEATFRWAVYHDREVEMMRMGFENQASWSEYFRGRCVGFSTELLMKTSPEITPPKKPQ